MSGKENEPAKEKPGNSDENTGPKENSADPTLSGNSEAAHEIPTVDSADEGTAQETTGEKEDDGAEPKEPPGVRRESGRERQPTERGKALALQLKQKAFRNAISHWKRTATDIEVRVAEATSTDQLRALRPLAEEAVSAVSEAYAELEKSDPENEAEFKKLDITQEHYSRIGALIAERHREINLEERSTRSTHSSSSRHSRTSRNSRASRKSTRSSNASVRVKAVSEAASLQAKLRTLQEENAKKIEIAKLTGELEEIQTIRDLEKAKATIRAIEEDEELDRQSEVIFMDREDDQPVDIVERYLNSFDAPRSKPQRDCSEDLAPPVAQPLNPRAEEFRPSRDIVTAMEGFTEQVSLSRLPPPEPEIFKGDPLRYPAWKASFQTLIERKRIPAEEKLFYLTKYLADGPLKAVRGFLLTSGDEESYIQAKNLLQRRYGDSFLVANAFRNQLNEWPKIASKDGPGLQNFTDFLNQCLTAKRTLEGLNILDDCQENQKIIGKLPEWMVHRWSRIVADHRQKNQSFPKFDAFVRFIEKESLIANDPVFATRSSHIPKKKFSTQEEKGSRCLSTQKLEIPEKQEKETGEINCYFCDREGHDLDVCRTFMNKPYLEKQAFMQRKGLCFGCLARGHMVKGCKNRKKCRKCEKSHPTVFHKEVPTEKSKASTETAVSHLATSVSHLAASGSASKSTMIVPVWVYCEKEMTKKRLVYAMLDTQSDTTFVTEKTCEELGITGTSTSLKLSTMSSTDNIIPSEKISGLKICGFTESEEIRIPIAYTRENIPVNRDHIPTARTASRWEHLKGISGDMSQTTLDIDVGLLIGYNCPRALAPLEVIVGGCYEPYGLRTPLGWSIVGITESGPSDDFGGVCHRLSSSETHKRAETSESTLSLRPGIKEVLCPQQVVRTLERDFSENLKGRPFSIEDSKFLKILGDGLQLRKDNHFEMPLPMRDSPALVNNYQSAFQRLRKLQQRLQKDERFRDHYVDFMERVIKQGYAEPVSEKGPSTTNGEVWYIPHHGVYHPRKPDKIRVVFDASAVFQGVSLNKRLLQGPDLTNNLIGVLCRFRQQPVAVMCDVEQMFYQFGVTDEYRDYLRFLWWKDGNTKAEIKEYRMTVHLFGATSSPGCANFGLKKLAEEAEKTHGEDVASFIRQNFYVDDGLTSLQDATEAISLLRRTKAACESRGLKLHKFVSNVPRVLKELVETNVPVKNASLSGPKDVERALGIIWNTEDDCFSFSIKPSTKNLRPTRREILSMVCSIYDPLGFLSPVILEGRLILQEICRDQLDWDIPLPEKLQPRWSSWTSSLEELQNVVIPRCHQPQGFGRVKDVELHHFSDASSMAYGQCSYLRLVNEQGRVHCSLVMAKSRVAPMKAVSIPRLELTAALVAVKISRLLNEELQFENITNYYWTDSQVVLGYIANEAKKFHVFVANRVQQIKDSTEVDQWNFVRGKDNPADEASRGLSASALTDDSRWLSGPEFLWQEKLPSKTPLARIPDDDPEVKATVMSTRVTEDSNILTVLNKCSSFSKAVRIVALCLRWSKNRKKSTGELEELDHSRNVLTRLIQIKFFDREREMLAKCKTDKNGVTRQEVRLRNENIKGVSNLFRLDPFLDEDGIMRVGGRIKRADMPFGLKHPAIIPGGNHLTTLMIRHFHEKVLHQGRPATTNAIRNAGFWIIGCSSAVRHYIRECITCRRLLGSTAIQKMSGLPEERLHPSPPFTHCGMDLFGPFLIKEGRKEMKRYGVIFTCLASRAIHIETAISLETDSFLNALRRLIAIRGPVRSLSCDCGTNFVGAEKELAKAFQEMTNNQVKDHLIDQGCDFKFNPPHASHMGGVWERQIRSVRRILSTLLHQSGTHLDDESLRTFCCEAAAIVNSRPLTVENLNDPLAGVPISPNQLLTMKSGIVLPPPGNFERQDLYARKRWKRVQHIANEFWYQWKREFLHTLQPRQKWTKPQRNFQVGDIVLVVDENQPRSIWPLARVESVREGTDGKVRRVKVMLANSNIDGKGRRKKEPSVLERPIHKLVLLVENETTAKELELEPARQ